MSSLKESRTEGNLKRAFLDQAVSDRRYLRCAQAAEAGGFRDLAAQIRANADNEAGFARGHLDNLVVEDNVDFAKPGARSETAMASAIAAMRNEHSGMYAGMARTAHQEGFEEVAGWFETLAKAGRSQARRLRRALDNTS